MTLSPRPMPGTVDPPLVVGLDRPRPGAHALGRVRPERDAVEQAVVARPADALDPDLDPSGRHAGHVDQPDAERLLGDGA